MFCVSCIMDKDVWGKRIGAEGTFCARSACGCKVKSNWLVCHEFENKFGNFYVIKIGEVATSNQFLRLYKVLDELHKDWVGLSLSSTEWVWLFGIVEEEKEAATQESVNVGLQAKGTADLYWTPAKQPKSLSGVSIKYENTFSNLFSPFQQLILVNLEKEDEVGPSDPERMQSDNTGLENGFFFTVLDWQSILSMLYYWPRRISFWQWHSSWNPVSKWLENCHMDSH